MTDDLARVRANVLKVAREAIRRAVDARREPVQFSQGCYDAITRTVPTMIADGVARHLVLAKVHEAAVAKVITLELQIENLQTRLAVMEDKLQATPDTPARAIDPGTVVPFGLRSVASA